MASTNGFYKFFPSFQGSLLCTFLEPKDNKSLTSLPTNSIPFKKKVDFCFSV